MKQEEKVYKAPDAHELKTWPEYFQAIIEGRKIFEIRKNDRNFKVGDILRLIEWAPQRYSEVSPNTLEGIETGRRVEVQVTYIYQDLGSLQSLLPGYCVMSIQSPSPLTEAGQEKEEINIGDRFVFKSGDGNVTKELTSLMGNSMFDHRYWVLGNDNNLYSRAMCHKIPKGDEELINFCEWIQSIDWKKWGKDPG